MTGAQIDVFLQTFGILAILLIVGTVLRAKVPLFQKLFLPSCVLGGVLGLILGPRVLGILPFSEGIMTTASSLPGRLFAIIIAAMPMCAAKMKKGELLKRFDAINLGIIITIVSALQFVVGFAINVIFRAIGQPVYEGYGLEMMLGFCGGHGTASTIGGIFENLGQDYWEAAQGIGMTFATIGMVFGIAIGIAFLNVMARKGQTHYVTNPHDLPLEMKTGLCKDPAKQPSSGKQTTAGGSIDVIALHLAYILTAVAIGYAANSLVKKYSIPGLIYMSTWFYGLVAMYIMWPLTRALGLDTYFDASTKSHIQGFVTDFIVTAAIMSMPISVIIEYWLPILLTAILGFAVTVPVILILNRIFLAEDWVEKSMGPLGMMTGDFITGVMLTRMVDPDFKSKAMEDFSIAYSINTFYCVAMVAILFPYVVTKGAFSSMLFTGCHAVILIILLLIFAVWKKKNK